MFSPLEGHLRGHFIMFSTMEGHTRGCFIMFSPLAGHPRGWFIMFSPLAGHPRGWFIMFSPLEAHPGGHFIMFSTMWGCPKGHLIMNYLPLLSRRIKGVLLLLRGDCLPSITPPPQSTSALCLCYSVPEWGITLAKLIIFMWDILIQSCSSKTMN